MPCNHDPQLVTFNRAFGGFNAADLAVFLVHGGDFAFLDDIHTHVRTGPRIAPSHCIMARRSPARLPKRTQHRIARPVQIDDGTQFLNTLWSDKFRGNTLQRVGMRRALIPANFMLRLSKHHNTAWTEHHIVIQILTERFIKPACFFIDRCRRVLEIVGADNRCIAPRIAPAKPTFFDDGNIFDPKVTPKVIGRGKPMSPRTNDDHIIFFLGLRIAPGPFPAGVKAQGFTRDSEGRITFHTGIHSNSHRCAAFDKISCVNDGSLRHKQSQKRHMRQDVLGLFLNWQTPVRHGDQIRS